MLLRRFLLGLVFAFLFTFMPDAAVRAAEWYETAGSRANSVSQPACFAATQALLRVNLPFRIRGNPATERLYAEMTRAERDRITGGQPRGTATIETHTLSTSDGATLAGSFRDVADVKVPFLVQVATLPFPPVVGAGITLLDWLLQQDRARQAAANDVAVLIRSGGFLERTLIVTLDAQSRPWIMSQVVFRTTVNTETHRYVICALSMPLRITG